MTQALLKLEEWSATPGARRLGRHIEHDERSKDYPAEMAVSIASAYHPRFVPIFDQGSLGSCTGNAMAGVLGTAPFYNPWLAGLSAMEESDAIDIYEIATQVDGFPGVYPPDDTGSSGLAAAKAAKQLGLISLYRHAFGIKNALLALSLRPVMTGVDWYEGFDRPDSNGLVQISGDVRGGHEFVVCGLDAERQLVRAANSWGSDWGDHGYFQFSFETWDQLLSDTGDVTTVHGWRE